VVVIVGLMLLKKQKQKLSVALSFSPLISPWIKNPQHTSYTDIILYTQFKN